MIVSCAEMKQIEERVFASGIAAGMLMEDAGEQIAAAVRQFHPRPSTCLAFVGRGHNGGDALVAGRHLAQSGWEVRAELIFERNDCSELTGRMLREFMPLASKRTISRPAVVLDGLLGIGAHGPLREPILRATREINRLRRESGASIFAIDIPTGVDGDGGEVQSDAVAADVTLTIGFAKAGLLEDAATAHVGRLAVLPLRELTRPAALSQQGARVMTAQDVAALLPRRRFDVHKGDFGKIGIIAGSRGLTGAAVMCANACVRAGAGLVTLYVTEDIHPIVAAAVSPEVMARPVRSYLEVIENDRDVLALGPGLGEKRRDEVLEIIARAEQPLILDADAINIIARSPGALHGCAAPRLLTPHPGEMKRLDPGSANLSRRETLEKFVARFPHTLLLKGSRTIVGERGKPISYNSTGSPGMASGGMGDVLTGVCAALAGHGLSLYDAACTAAWVCGRAAELAISHGNESEESLAAMRLVEWLGRAFRDARGGCY